jgi:hypothetical protein
VMVYSARQVDRARQMLAASPHGMIADLTMLYERELESWTAPRWQLSVLVVACAGLLLAVQRIFEAFTRHENMLLPFTILFVYLAALLVVGAVGVKRVRVLRQELGTLDRIRTELT